MSAPLPVLLVANSRTLRAPLAECLARDGFSCDVVSDAAAGRTLLSVRQYGLAIVEVNVGDLDGLQILADLARRVDRPKLFVFVPSHDTRLLHGLTALQPDELFFLPAEIEAVAEKARLLSRNLGTISSVAAHSMPVPLAETAQAKETASASTSASTATSASDSASASASGSGSGKAIVAIRVADPSRGRELSALLAAEGFTAIVCETTDELHARLSGDRIDLLVIEERLPGFLDGLDVLERFNDELLRPEAVLLAEATVQPERIRAIQPARVVCPNRPNAEIVDAVRGAASQRRTGGIIVALTARQVVARHPGVRPMPQLLVKLTGYLGIDAARVPINELARDIAVDPKATTELLRYTNGSALGLRRRVTSIADAVTLHGARKSISLILASAMIASTRELLKNWPQPLENWYHRRSVLTACVAHAFAGLEGVSPDTAFLLGLLQELGIVVQADSAGEKYEQVVRRASSIAALRLDLVEQAEFGHTHAEVSAALLQRWEMPPSLIRPVLAHHGDDSSLSATERSFVRLMRIGEAIADLSDCPGPQRQQTLNRLLTAYGSQRETACRDALANAVAKTVEASKLFSLPTPDPETLRRVGDCLSVQHSEMEAAAELVAFG